MVEFADSALLFRIQFWIDDPTQRLSSLSEILEDIYIGLQEQGISIPFPQRDVWLKGDPLSPNDAYVAATETD